MKESQNLLESLQKSANKTVASSTPNGKRRIIKHGERFVIEDLTITGTIDYQDHFNRSGVLALPEDSNFGVVGPWSGLSYHGAQNRMFVSPEGMNGNCLKGFKNPSGDPEGFDAPNTGMSYWYPTPVPLNKKLFSSFYIKHDSDFTRGGGQCKWSRWCVTESVSDKPSEVYCAITTNAQTDICIIRNNDGVDFGTTKYGPFTERFNFFHRDQWARVDFLHTLPTTFVDRASYKAEAWFHDPEGKRPPFYKLYTNNQVVDEASPYIMASDYFTNHVYQIYWGNDQFGSTKHTQWMDKMVESVGDDLVLIELGDKPVFAECGRRFIQPLIAVNSAVAEGEGDVGDLLTVNGSTAWLFVTVNGTVVYTEEVEVTN